MKLVNKAVPDGTISNILEAERNGALGSIVSSDLSEQRIRAYNYYMGDMSADMPNVDGLSNAVSSDVQDIVEGLLPILLDVITSSQNIVEFTPRSFEDEAAAAQETEYVNHVFYQENQGFLTLHNAVKDALLSKNCFIKWWMEPDVTKEREEYKGLTEDAFAMLTADTDVKVVKSEEYQDTDPATQQPAKFYNAVTERSTKTLKPKVAAFPPEEWLVSKNARDIQNATYLAHVQRKPQADIIAVYKDKAEIIRAAPSAVSSQDNNEAFNRQTVEDRQDDLHNSSDINKDMRVVEITEHFIRMALEEDKVARRYRITTVGTKYDILDIEEMSSWPVASGTAIIMPHRLFGRAVADLAVEVQQIKTSLLRSTLNNAYFSNNARTEVSETHASENTLDDLLNNRVGGIVRTKMPGGLIPIETQSIVDKMVPIIEYVDGATERRVGLSKNTTGLDVDSMNHARTGAVGRIMDSAEMRVKMMARVLAETLLVDMFTGIHGMLQEYSEEQSTVKLTGGWVPVNPREWKTRRQMKVNLPVGGVGKQQMLAFFMQVLGVQKEAMATGAGPNGPLVSWEGVYSTLDHMMKLAGLKGAEGFFMKPPPPNPNAPPPPDPRMVEAQAKAQATQQQTQASIQADQQQMQADMARDQQKQQSAMEMEQLKLAAKHKQEQDEFAHRQMLDRMKFQHETEMAQIQAAFDMKLEKYKADEQIKIDKAQAAQQAKAGVGEV